MGQFVSDIRYTHPETVNVLLLLDRGYYVSQIARMLGKPVSTIHSRLRNARKTFNCNTNQELLALYKEAYEATDKLEKI